MKFELAVQRLSEANMPCRLFEAANGLTIELGAHWPVELIEVLDRVVPEFTGSVCGASYGHEIIQESIICGGPREDYFYLRF